MKHIVFLSFCFFIISSLSAQLSVQAHAGTDTTICAGDSIQIGDTPISTNTTPPLTITWSPNVNISSTNTSHPMVWPSATTTYYLTVTDFNGRSGYDSITVTPHFPDPVSMDSIPPVCIKGTVVHLTQGSPLGGIYKGKTILDSVSFIPIFAGIGNHLITYLVKDEICQTIDSASNSILVLPSPVLNSNKTIDSLCEGDSTTISVSGSSISYLWKPNYNVQTSSVGDTAILFPDSTINYYVIGTNSEGCKDSLNIHLVVNKCYSGLKSNKVVENLEVFPNPFNSELLIMTTTELNLNLRLYNSMGIMVRNECNQSNGELSLETSQLVQGYYILEVIDERNRLLMRKKVLKIHN